jgi:copper chaperone
MVTFRVPDMTCGHCASSIARAVAAVDKAARVDVSLADQRVVVDSTAAESELMEAIREAGYSPEPAAPVPQAATSSGCCCANRKAAPVDTGQVRATPRSSCCN